MLRVDGTPTCRGRLFPSLSGSARSRATSRDRGKLGALLVLFAMCTAPLALAQTTTPKKPKKGSKAAASASASASASATDDAPPPAPPAASASASDQAAAPKDDAAEKKAESPADDPTNTTEDPAKKYYFVGLRYKGTIIPQFLENLFVDDGGTVYSNSLGLELDIRQDGRSIIPWIQYTDYGMGDTLFLTKGKDPTDPTQYSVVNSGLKAIYLGLDEMWSAPIADHLDFEYGFGVGLGFVFGNLQNNWIYPDPTGPLHASATFMGTNTSNASECPAGSDQTMPQYCSPNVHSGSSDTKVGGYVEKNWLNGGSVPVVFPHISIPQIGLRYKPFKQFVARLQTGFSITGFYWSLSAEWGLEKNEADEKPAPKHKPKSTDNDKESSSYFVPGRDTL